MKPDGTSTAYVGGVYEVELSAGGQITKKTSYYGVAMRVEVVGVSNTLYFVLRDHLGSASVTLDASGNVVANGEQRYYPFGESRIAGAALPTDRLYTGQRDTGLGLYHYGARFYSSALGRFISADSIVPNWTNPQSLNRYAYVLNSPMRYVDPTGHSCFDLDTETVKPGNCGKEKEQVGQYLGPGSSTYGGGGIRGGNKPPAPTVIGSGDGALGNLGDDWADSTSGDAARNESSANDNTVAQPSFIDYFGTFPWLLVTGMVRSQTNTPRSLLVQDLYAIGGANTPPKIKVPGVNYFGVGPGDVVIEKGMIQPSTLLPRGGSTFETVQQLAEHVNGWVWKLPTGTKVGSQFMDVADNAQPGHHTLAPNEVMTPSKCAECYSNLGWQRTDIQVRSGIILGGGGGAPLDMNVIR